MRGSCTRGVVSSLAKGGGGLASKCTRNLGKTGLVGPMVWSIFFIVSCGFREMLSYHTPVVFDHSFDVEGAWYRRIVIGYVTRPPRQCCWFNTPSVQPFIDTNLYYHGGGEIFGRRFRVSIVYRRTCIGCSSLQRLVRFYMASSLPIVVLDLD